MRWHHFLAKSWWSPLNELLSLVWESSFQAWIQSFIWKYQQTQKYLDYFAFCTMWVVVVVFVVARQRKSCEHKCEEPHNTLKTWMPMLLTRAIYINPTIVGGGAFRMYCTQRLDNCCYVWKGMGITGSIGHKDGSQIERKLGPNELPYWWWRVDGDIAQHVDHVTMWPLDSEYPTLSCTCPNVCEPCMPLSLGEYIHLFSHILRRQQY